MLFAITFCCNFALGEKSGRGIYRAAAGTVYDGEYLADLRHGRGTYKYANGNVFDGVWENDEAVGAVPAPVSLASTSGAKNRRTKIASFMFLTKPK